MNVSKNGNLCKTANVWKHIKNKQMYVWINENSKTVTEWQQWTRHPHSMYTMRSLENAVMSVTLKNTRHTQ